VIAARPAVQRGTAVPLAGELKQYNPSNIEGRMGFLFNDEVGPMV
jgi:hypothetical protein